MSNSRGKVLKFLLDELNFDARALLESIVEAQSNDEVFEALEFVSRVEDWSYRVDSRGVITDTENRNQVIEL